MILVVGEVDVLQVKLLRKVAIGLHFPFDNVNKLCDEAILLVTNENDLVNFTAVIKIVDSI
jgi:hypothetical protein